MSENNTLRSKLRSKVSLQKFAPCLTLKESEIISQIRCFSHKELILENMFESDIVYPKHVSAIKIGGRGEKEKQTVGQSGREKERKEERVFKEERR